MKYFVRDVSAFLAFCAAIAIVAIGITLESSGEGWFTVLAYWPIYLSGLGALTFAVLNGATKWLLLIAPVFLVPFGMGMLLIYACSQGDCL